jgi:hypothetical protein
MRVSAENALSFALFCVAERALCYLRRETQPSCVETVKVAGKPFASGIDLLQPQENQLAHPGQPQVPDPKAVKLVSVDGHVPLAGVAPHIFLVHGHSHQVRHDLGKAMVVVSFHPHDLNSVLRIG